MFATIGVTLLGNIPWQSFAMSYNGIKPQDNVPLDPLELVRNMLANPDFDGEIEFLPYCDWAWNQAASETHGLTFMLLIMGSDNTIVSVATGHTKYHPLYLLISNIFNSRSLAKIFESVKTFMETPDVMHFLNNSKDLDGGQPCLHRHKEHTELLLWSKYGIISDLIPFTNDFPHADIHELLSPDLLHQIIKGTFKDHLVDWVEDYLMATYGARLAAEIMDDIDQRIAVVTPFTGRRFKQWTGDDSKVLMKVYIPAIKDHVPEDITCAFSMCLDFCYLVWHEALTEDNLVQLQEVLECFHEYQEIFKTTGVTTSFSLPHQHSMCHYILMIQLFGAPNGLCSSITESKHIKAVKEPWCHSSRFKALGQMLLMNQHLDKVAAALADFEACSMLCGHNNDEDSELDDDAMAGTTLAGLPGHLQVHEPQNQSIKGDAGEVLDGPTAESHIELGVTPHESVHMSFDPSSQYLECVLNVETLGLQLDLPHFPGMIQEFLHDQLHSMNPDPPHFDPMTAPIFLGKATLFNSAAVTFYAPSDLSSTRGMHHEYIRSTPSWWGGPARHDCIFINMDADADSPMGGLSVAWVLCLFSFQYWTSYFPCAVVHWYSHILKSHDPDTGMYIVTPGTTDNGTPDISIVHIDCVFMLPTSFCPYNSYDTFDSFYVNKYVDHHTFEIA
ncbi:hypothetical protein BDR06DRAFT_983915 [Suillus hirtellus]|nr:hypothetical protein BDR06DRAFT_983915 [Suillus hirtellus]